MSNVLGSICQNQRVILFFAWFRCSPLTSCINRWTGHTAQVGRINVEDVLNQSLLNWHYKTVTAALFIFVHTFCLALLAAVMTKTHTIHQCVTKSCLQTPRLIFIIPRLLIPLTPPLAQKELQVVFTIPAFVKLVQAHSHRLQIYFRLKIKCHLICM